MTAAEYMQTDYRAAGATLADFVQTVSLAWIDLKELDLPDDIDTTVKISDTAGNELSDLLPFDKEHPADGVGLYTWAEMFGRSIADIRTGDGMTCDYEIILE